VNVQEKDVVLFQKDFIKKNLIVIGKVNQFVEKVVLLFVIMFKYQNIVEEKNVVKQI